jgi:hypothetical protein
VGFLRVHCKKEASSVRRPQTEKRKERQRTVSRRLDRLRKLSNGDLEATLDELEDLLVALVRDESDSETLGSETTGATASESERISTSERREKGEGKKDEPNTVKVRVSISRRVVVDDDVDAFDVDTTTEDVGRDEDTLLERLELLVPVDALLLVQTGVDRDRGEVALPEETVEFGRARDGLDEDADLRKREGEGGRKVSEVEKEGKRESRRTWLNSNESSKSFNLRFLADSSRRTKCC